MVNLMRSVPYSVVEQLKCNRLDAEFIVSDAWKTDDGVSSTEIFEILKQPKTNSNTKKMSEPTEGYYYCEIGAIDRIGQFAPVMIELDEQDPEPDRQKQIDRLRKKVNNGDIWAYHEPLVLVPITRPYLGKFAIITGQEENTYFTTALMPFKAGTLIQNECSDPLTATCFLYLLLKIPLHEWLSSLARWGKSYPTLNANELRKAVIPRNLASQLINDAGLEAAIKLAEAIRNRESANRKFVDTFHHYQNDT